MAKEFTFRGKTIEQLKTLDTREFAKLTKSRTRRAILRQSSGIEGFVAKCIKYKAKNKQIKTHLRDIIIVPKLVDYTVMIHNGKTFLPIPIIPEMLGHRLGEFALTRNKVKHGAAGIGASKSSMAKATKK
ncbi:MAG: ribosomal protein S19 family protein [archaeon]|nr:ribosomal protein S19 family protein [archaeon]